MKERGALAQSRSQDTPALAPAGLVIGPQRSKTARRKLVARAGR